MLQLEHKRRIVDACYPSSQQEALELWNDIKPVKFGSAITWVAGTVTLAEYVIPEDAAYMLVLRVECYVSTFIAAAPGFGQFSPPPGPGATAFWQYTDISTATNSYRVTNRVPIFILCDTDEFLIGKGDHRLSLIAQLDAAPDANTRIIRTLVYGYLVGALIAGKLGSGHSGGGTQVGAVVFRSDSSIAYANRTNTTIIAPVGIQDNDFLQTVFLIGGPTGLVPAVATSTGFSEILTAPYPLSGNVGGFEGQSRLYWKPASGESGNYQFNHAAANTTAYMLAASGASLVAPTATGGTDPTGVNPIAPSITTLLNHALIIFFAQSFDFLGAVTPPGSPTVFTERLDSAGSILSVATGDMVAAGPTGNKTVTVTLDPSAAGLIAIEHS